jgi:hypothetical protein
MKCPECQKEMVNLGNVFNIVMTSYPVQWDDIYVCHDCKTKTRVRVSGDVISSPDILGYTNF